MHCRIYNDYQKLARWYSYNFLSDDKARMNENGSYVPTSKIKNISLGKKLTPCKKISFVFNKCIINEIHNFSKFKIAFCISKVVLIKFFFKHFYFTNFFSLFFNKIPC